MNSSGGGGGGSMNPFLMLFVTVGAVMRWYRRQISR
jgi:hypothetical protein